MSLKTRVTDGVRTRDNRNHNPALYQLSYTHQEGGPEPYRPLFELQAERSSAALGTPFLSEVAMTLATNEKTWDPE